MRVHLGGHLNWYDPQKRTWVELSLPTPVTLLDLARQLGVPAAEIAVAVVNRRAVDLETTTVSNSDIVEFFSAVGGG